MRYFRYKNIDKNVNNALKEQYKILTEDEKRTFRKEKRWRRFSTLVTLTVFISCITGGIFLLKSIPLPNFWLLEALAIVAKVIVGFILLIASGVLTAVLVTPLWKKVETYDIPICPIGAENSITPPKSNETIFFFKLFLSFRIKQSIPLCLTIQKSIALHCKLCNYYILS